MKIFLFFLIISVHVQARPSRFSCDFYQEVESAFQCGPKGYLQVFGIPLCRKYLGAEPKLSKNLVVWLQDVRLCLQEELEKDLESSVGCRELKRFSLKSHERCFKITGFCDLTVRQKLKVAQLTSSRIFSREVLSIATKLPALCR